MYLFKSYFLNKRVPENLEDVSKYPNLFAELIADNWSDDDLAKLAGQNILRVLSDVEKVCFKIIFFSPSKIIINFLKKYSESVENREPNDNVVPQEDLNDSYKLCRTSF